MLTHGEWLSLAAGIEASGVCLVVVAGVGAALSSWRDALDVTRPETVSGELDRRLADKARDDAILAAWKERNPLPPAPTSAWSPTEGDSVKIRAARELWGNLSQARRPTLREAVEALPDGAEIMVSKGPVMDWSGKIIISDPAERAAILARQTGVNHPLASAKPSSEEMIAKYGDQYDAWFAELFGNLKVRDVPTFCPDTTAERAKAPLEAAKVAVPEPDVYAWRSVAEVLGR